MSNFMPTWVLKVITGLFFIALHLDVCAQQNVSVIHTDIAPIIDGELDEAIWDSSDAATDFWQYSPSDTTQAQAQTEIKMSADEQNLYIGIKCFAKGDDWIVRTLKRDYRAGGSDNLTLIFDPFNDGVNAYFFGINPEGVIREGTISNGGIDFGDFDESWDNKWSGEAKIHDGYYTAELAIPFSTLRYNATLKNWSFNAYRFETQSNEISTWNNIPRNQPMMSLAFMGDMIWDKAPPKSGRNISIIPYVSTSVSKDFEAGTSQDFGYSAGGDAKIGITDGLNLDLTFNPDFSQVEVDRQITNLDRFEIFFPERRQFFIENADLFSNFGFGDINPFFSRRIGVATDQITDNTVQNRILVGARLSGKITNNTRLGVLNMQTESNQDRGILGTNFSVAAIQTNVLKRSNLSFMMVNRSTLGELQNFDQPDHTGNTIGGVDFNFFNHDNTISGKTFMHYNLRGGSDGVSMAHGTRIDYSTRSLGVSWRHDYVGDGYVAPVGFVRRTNYYKFTPNVRYRWYPSESVFIDYSLRLNGDIFYRPEVGKTDHRFNLNWSGQFQNSGRVNANLRHQFILLTGDFDPTGTDSDQLLEGTSYNFLSLEASYRSDRRKLFGFSVRPTVGQYFNGFRIGMGGDFEIRSQPKATFSIRYNWNYFDMPHLGETKQTFLIGPRLDYTFSKELFFSTFIQYNSQSQNTNINTRLQWRFAPASDFFLVWTDNYETGYLDGVPDRFSLNTRNRAIVAKFTYWFNL